MNETMYPLSFETGYNADYQGFLLGRTQNKTDCGFEPNWMPDFLFPFQRLLVEWAIRKGRSLIGADCGLGKGPMQFVWCENVIRHTNRPVLYVTTLGDSLQTVAEAAKFGIQVYRSRDGKFPATESLIVTNYERLKHFNPDDFAAVSANESSCIKDFDGKMAGQIRDFMRTHAYRLLCTATPSPNDYPELGTSAEALGHIGYMDMLARFFRSDNATLHPFRTYLYGRPKGNAIWEFRPYAERDFWRWVCSWARVCRKPSDLGFSDEGYDLPPHEIRYHTVEARKLQSGIAFEMPANGLQRQAQENARTVVERCERAAELLADASSGVAWCHLNTEGNTLKSLIPGAEQVGSSAQSDDLKEELFLAFVAGQVRVMVTKPRIAGFGLNWQHCHRQTYFPSNSYEQFKQSISRLHRFGQQHTVTTDIISTVGGQIVLDNLTRKAKNADRQFTSVLQQMNDAMNLTRTTYGDKPMEQPLWQRQA